VLRLQFWIVLDTLGCATELIINLHALLAKDQTTTPWLEFWATRNKFSQIQYRENGKEISDLDNKPSFIRNAQHNGHMTMRVVWISNCPVYEIRLLKCDHLVVQVWLAVYIDW